MNEEKKNTFTELTDEALRQVSGGAGKRADEGIGICKRCNRVRLLTKNGYCHRCEAAVAGQ